MELGRWHDCYTVSVVVYYTYLLGRRHFQDNADRYRQFRRYLVFYNHRNGGECESGCAKRAESGKRRDRREHDADADVECDRRHELRRAVRHNRSAADGGDRAHNRDVRAGDAHVEHDVLLANRGAQQRGLDDRAGLVVYDPPRIRADTGRWIG